MHTAPRLTTAAFQEGRRRWCIWIGSGLVVEGRPDQTGAREEKSIHRIEQHHCEQPTPMPRIPPSIFRRAHQLSPHAATLLPVCRDVPTAANELRWIREHAQMLCPSPAAAGQHVASLCRRRGRGEPLQYVLGTQPFGNLEMKCRRGVLIPRCVVSCSLPAVMPCHTRR